VGGSVVIDLGLRQSTLDIHYVADADDATALSDLETAVRDLKIELYVKVNPASRADFLPIPRSALGSSRYVGRFGRLDAYYYDLPSQIIAKAARGDLSDAERLLEAGVVSWEAVEAQWADVRSSPTGWIRYEPSEIDERLEVLRRRFTSASD
jgi:hypothetical protein